MCTRFSSAIHWPKGGKGLSHCVSMLEKKWLYFGLKVVSGIAWNNDMTQYLTYCNHPRSLWLGIKYANGAFRLGKISL